MNPIEWIKNNKLSTLLFVLLAFFVFKNSSPLSINKSYRSVNSFKSTNDAEIAIPSLGSASLESKSFGSILPPPSEAVPQTDVQNRMVIESSNMSMVVNDVRQKMDKILSHVESKNGYMVSSNLNQPEEKPYANLIVRVPSQELRPTLEYLRGLAVKVTSENLKGRDVTDQYMDIDARLKTLEKTKLKFEEIMDKATKVQDILQVQREIISLQSQIDSLKGQQKYLEKSAESAKLSIHLSTDEWSLPYAPEDSSFRPKLIFKQAVRALVQTFRGLASKAIWIGVYSIIWVPTAIIIWVFWKKRKKTAPH